MNEILRSRKVWASDCRFLNDSHEFSRAEEMFLNKFQGNNYEAMRSAFHWHSYSRALCIFSLSKSAEVLSQWRAYGDDGQGAAIGFNRQYLTQVSSGSYESVVDCVYSDHDGFIDRLVNDHQSNIDDIISMYNNNRGVNSFWERLDKKPAGLESIYCQLLRIKNEAFVEECEVRLTINVPKTTAMTRVSKGLIVPYVEHPWADENEEHLWCIAPEIWLGPKCDERNKDGLGAFSQFGWVVNESIKKFDCGYV